VTAHRPHRPARHLHMVETPTEVERISAAEAVTVTIIGIGAVCIALAAIALDGTRLAGPIGLAVIATAATGTAAILLRGRP
jgi:hypothetical protein